MNTCEIPIYQNSKGIIKIDVRNRQYIFNSFAIYYISLKATFQSFITLFAIICTNLFAKWKNCLTFDTNNTCHASHKNSAPGQVFAFYRLLVSKPLNSRAYALQ